MLRLNFFLLLITVGPLWSFQIPARHLFPDHPTLQAPWFTGPLLTPSPTCIPRGHVNYEPYIFVQAQTGYYNDNWKYVDSPTQWINLFQPSLQIGAASWLEIDITPTISYNYSQGSSKWVCGDCPIAFCVKLVQTRRDIEKWNTALRIEFRGVIPFGKYQKLDPNKHLTDIGGNGSWSPALALDWGNFFYIGGGHFVTARASAAYTIPNPVKVKGLNSYGGDSSTDGTVYPSQSLQIFSAIEVSLTQNWVIVMEAEAQWGGRRRFKGETVKPMTNPTSAHFAISPAIEYNFSSQLGIIFGPWISIAGRNSEAFVTGVFALNYFN